MAELVVGGLVVVGFAGAKLVVTRLVVGLAVVEREVVVFGVLGVVVL